jgi:hypothetical protein
MPLTFEEDQARRRALIDAIAAEMREQIRRERAERGDRPEDAGSHPVKRAAGDARAIVHAKRSESRDVDDAIARLLNGENPDDGATLAEVRVLRERQAALPAELAAAEDALALAESRLQRVLDAEAAAERAAFQEQARAAERALNEKRKQLSFEYHRLAMRMQEIDRQLNDPTERMAVMAQLRAAGLA